MRHLWGCGVVLGISLLGPATAVAEDPPFDSAIDVQLFDYAIGPKTFFSVADADVAAKKQLAVDALVTFMTNPFTVYRADGPDHMTVGPVRSRVVESMAAGQLTAAYGVNDKLQVGLDLPLVFSLQGQGLDPVTGMPSGNGLNVTGVGDLIGEAKYSLMRRGDLRLSGIGAVTLPTSVGSDKSQFIGDDLPTVRGKLAAQWSQGKVSVGANAGFILRKPRTIYSSTIGQQLTWGVAAAYKITDRFSVIGEGFGRTGVTSQSLDDSPIEVVGGLRLFAAGAVAVVVGGGAGLDQAIGAPDKMFFASVGYAPDVRDSDGDGIANARDKCPLIAEDKDGFQDDDGCPDDDNDGDRRPDAEDKCPNEAEDLDGFDDDDGCPELDNDKDTIADLADKCPLDAEDGKEPYPKDGCPADKRDSDADGIADAFDQCPKDEEDMDSFEDGDGCPELDNDNDGVPDATDKCPLCPEDKDGFEDDDGCPELDNDKDGVPDMRDACPAEPETVNGIKDDDGCPDTGGATNVVLDGDRLAVNKMPRNANDPIVTQMAIVMAAHTEVTKWLVAVAMPSKTAAQSLGDAVQKKLTAAGVPNVEILAASGPAKIGGLVQERADTDATPVCPAGREVQPRPEASKPATAPQTSPQPTPMTSPSTSTTGTAPATSAMTPVAPTPAPATPAPATTTPTTPAPATTAAPDATAAPAPTPAPADPKKAAPKHHHHSSKKATPKKDDAEIEIDTP
jgi:OOP family OmpA-OmpF porin